MKQSTAVVATPEMLAMVAMLALASPVHAQLGDLLGKAQKIQEAKSKFDDLNVTEEEERKIGDDVSAKIRQRFGVVQDPAIHKYVTLVGTTLAQQSEQPNLAWTFVVLDTDSVNAFASPGGIVHITRGALGMITSEAGTEPSAGSRIGHVAHKHAVNAIKKTRAVQLGANETLSSRGPFLDRIANRAYDIVLENKFDRGDEMDSDKVSLTLAEKAGYAPGKLADFLTLLDERNKDQPESNGSNGLFASHPDTKARIDAIRKLAGTRSGAIVENRYKTYVKYKATPVTAIATVADGASAPAKPAEAKKEEEPKKKGFGIGALKQAVAPEKQSSQVSASGGSRGVGRSGGEGQQQPALVKVTVKRRRGRRVQRKASSKSLELQRVADAREVLRRFRRPGRRDLNGAVGVLFHTPGSDSGRDSSTVQGRGVRHAGTRRRPISEDPALGRGGDRRRAGLTGQQRHLAEDVSVVQPRSSPLVRASVTIASPRCSRNIELPRAPSRTMGSPAQ